MNYELAKKLKDAGFKQSDASYEGKNAWVNSDNVHCNNIISDAIYCPTLSELIEACGEKFDDLNRLGEGGEFEWYTTGEIEGYTRFYGSTPEEAVANLWLELQKITVDKLG